MTKKKSSTVFEELTGPLSVGVLIRAYRTTNAITLDQLAKKLNLTKVSLQQIENGKKKLSLKETVKFARKLGEFEDFYILIWFQSEARDAGIDFNKYLREITD